MTFVSLIFQELKVNSINRKSNLCYFTRKETRTIYLRNSSLLPVAWKLNGMENLGDDFSLPVDHGVIEPMNEFGLQMHFRAMKPINVKKVVRLEVRCL